MLLFCVVNVIIYVFSSACIREVMSGITVNDLGKILEEKLVPLQKRLDETFQSLSFINQQYEEIAKKRTLYEEERKDHVNENKSLKVELRDTTKKLNDLTEKCDDLEQYSRRECVDIRGIPLPANQQLENTDEIAIKFAVNLNIILLMNKFHNNLLPSVFNNYFTLINITHNYNTRLASKHSYSIP